MESTKKLKCERPGCGKEYQENENKDDSCHYHTGSAVFHEGKKGWTCCSKRVLTFDEFMEIPGCTLGRHSPHKETSKTYSEERKADVKLVSPSESEVEVYKSSNSVSVPPPMKEIKKVEEKKEEVEELDPVDAIISVGKECNHRGCSKTYLDESSRKEACVYHPGVPIFHETLKMWSCCKAKAMEFDKFLEIEGCKTGFHKFVDKIDASQHVHCRHEFYQSGASVTVSIYAKKVKKEESTIDIQPNKLIVNLKFEDGKSFNKTYNLFGQVDPQTSKIEYLSTRVELKLTKANGQNWNDFEKK